MTSACSPTSSLRIRSRPLPESTYGRLVKSPVVPLPFEVEAMPTPSNDAGEALAAGQHLIASVHVTQRAEPPSLLLIEAPFRLLPGSDTGLGWPLDGAMWTNLRPGPRPPFRHATYQLDESEVEELRTLWGILASLNTAALRFVASSLRRFTFAFDRFSAADRIVDLLVAAESLFLHDAVDPQQKMELRFRLAVR